MGLKDLIVRSGKPRKRPNEIIEAVLRRFGDRAPVSVTEAILHSLKEEGYEIKPFR